MMVHSIVWGKGIALITRNGLYSQQGETPI